MTDQRWTIRSGSVPALFWPDDENPDMPFSFTEADLAEMLPDALDRQVSAAFAAIADALRAAERDAKVAEIVANDNPGKHPYVLLARVAALYTEATS